LQVLKLNWLRDNTKSRSNVLLIKNILYCFYFIMCNGYILALKYTSGFDCRNVLVTFYDGMKKEFEFCADVKR